MIIAVKCPSCNANLQIPDDVEFVTCEYCDTSIKVRDYIRVETDYDVPEWIKIADNAYKGENYEEAYEYYNMVLEKESFRANAWIGKGLSAGRLSEENELRFDEMLQLVTYGLSITDEKKKNEETAAARKEIISILQDYFAKFRKDKFDSKYDFDNYISDNGGFVKACSKSFDSFFSKDIVFTKFYCLVLRNFLYKSYEYGAETRTLIEIPEPRKSEYRNKLRELESGLKALDKNYITFEESERKSNLKKIIVTGSAILLIALIVLFGVNYFKKVAAENKVKLSENTNESTKLPAAGYEIINKSVKNKKIIYTLFTETTSLDEVKKYADVLITRDEAQAQSITIYFLSDKSEADKFAGKDIPLNKNQKQMPDSFSARVKFTKGKDLKELHYYEKSKLTSETY
ncbi:MAG: hypothetical protein J0M18_13305 [Ignavibacteria bacterium]|nr:hypothetical protein [Ignavibacteria bacterium]